MQNYLYVRVADNVVENVVLIAGDPNAWLHGSVDHYVDTDPAGKATIGWQKVAGVYVPTAAVIAAAAALKSAQLQAAFAVAYAGGITVTDPTNGAQQITLPGDQNSQVNLTQGYTYLQSKGTAAGTMVSTLFPPGVVDLAGAAHDMTFAQYIVLVDAYAAVIAAGRAALLAKLAALAAATTLAQINAV